MPTRQKRAATKQTITRIVQTETRLTFHEEEESWDFFIGDPDEAREDIDKQLERTIGVCAPCGDTVWFNVTEAEAVIAELLQKIEEVKAGAE